MRPLRLELKNFMSYGEGVPPLSFEGMDVVCLSGPNGHGKSALLDAITWALWGRSRAKSDDDLIRHGRTHMLVDLEFELEGQRYRVRRERVRRGKRGHGALEFFVWDDVHAQWRPLTAPSMRATQRRIIDVVKLDYETFINSAYLKQGHADEFTNKSPGERKRILAEILRLDRYEELEKRAKEEARAAENRIATIQGRIQSIEEEIAREEAIRKELAEKEQELARLEGERRAAEARERELQSQVDHLKRRKRDVEQQQARVRQWEKELRRLEAEQAELRRQIEEAEAYLAQADAIRRRYQTLQEARAQNEAFNALLQKQVTLQQDLSQAQEAWNRARLEVERERSRLQQQRQELTAQAADLDEARRALEEATEHLARFDTLEETIQEARERLNAIRDEGTETRNTIRHLEQEIGELKERIARLENARGAATCPLCGQPLTESHLDRLLDQLRAELQEKEGRLQALQERVNTLLRAYREQEQEIRRLEQTRRGREQWQRAHAQAEARVQRAQDAITHLQAVEADLARVERSLEEGAFAPELHRRLQALRAQLAELGYDADAHAALRERLESLADAEDAYQALQEARTRLEKARERLRHLEEQRAQWEARRREEEELLRRLVEEVAALPDLERELRAQVALVDDLSFRERTLRAQVGGLRQSLAAIAEQKKRLETLRRELRKEEEARSIYYQLAQAFGKNGIQAMIIEAAIPEIEEKANELLNRMTNGRMSVRLITQKEKKTGGTAETLDIEIADEVGVRPYELYSGGEAFRINFALRVALSKLLARRAGASLRSLFIDEGFGSQDSEGRMRLVDAINAIREDFDLIVVITHIEELKAAFPVRIEIRKGREGSTYTVVV